MADQPLVAPPTPEAVMGAVFGSFADGYARGVEDARPVLTEHEQIHRDFAEACVEDGTVPLQPFMVAHLVAIIDRLTGVQDDA